MESLRTTISHLSIVRTWAACDAIEPSDNANIKQWLDDAIDMLKAQDALISMSGMVGKAHWIPCEGKSHIWYCSNCGEKINYNDARRTYQKEKKPVECVNRYCRGCGFEMLPSPTAERQLTNYSPGGDDRGCPVKSAGAQ